MPLFPVNDDVNIPSQRMNICQKIKVLDMFDNKEFLKLVIGKKCMEEGWQYRTSRSTKEMFEVACLVENCSWLIWAREIKSTTAWQVKKVVDQHTCSATDL